MMVEDPYRMTFLTRRYFYSGEVVNMAGTLAKQNP
jgi:hypothetical protein